MAKLPKKPTGSEPPKNPLDELRRNLAALELRAMLTALDGALEQAQILSQGYTTFLAGLVEIELLSCTEAAFEKRRKAAEFPRDTLTFDTFDWLFQKNLNVQLVKDLMNLDFVRQARPLLILGKPGTGKTHLSASYGQLAVAAGMTVRWFPVTKLLQELYAALATESVARKVRALCRPDLLILDDLRRVPSRPEYASLLCDVIDARYQKKSTILSSNLSVAEWGEVLGDTTLVACLVDRLLERAHIINIKDGRSYRAEGPDAPPVDDRPPELQNPTPPT